MQVTKRNGTTEPLNVDKIHEMLVAARDAGGNKLNVSVSKVAIKAKIQFFDGIKTSDIHDMCIRAAKELISEDEPDYQYLAGRLVNIALRKKLYGSFEVPQLASIISKLVDAGVYDGEVMNKYDLFEMIELGKYIDHDRDYMFTSNAMEQLTGKYLCQNRVTKEIYETPQTAYMLIAMTLFMQYPSKTRLDYVKRFYDAVSQFKISLPTPIMAGVRTPTRQFSSCVTIDTGDSLKSINASTSAIVEYISQKAGIGLNAGRIRALGSPIRGGEARHTGVIPFLKMFEAAVKSCSQGGLRGGAATVHFPFWHREIESIIVLKNNKGTEETRVRKVDYSIQMNGFMFRRILEGGKLSLFSPSDVPGLYEAFYANQQRFEELYLQYEADPSIQREEIDGSTFILQFMTERFGTGRLYVQFVDNVNNHSAFDPEQAPIVQSNLCVAPETLILTDKGYVHIIDVVDTEVNVWNGEAFVPVTVRKTSDSSKLLTVLTSYGYSINCTEYHKFYVMVDGEIVEKRANELEKNDVLIPLDCPTIEGAEYDKAAKHISDVLDSYGMYVRDGEHVELVIDTNMKYPFEGTSIQLELQTLGIPSYLKNGNQIAIAGDYFEKLTKVVSPYIDRVFDDVQYIAGMMPTNTIVGVVDTGREDATYCFEEPIRHMGVFNGLLTGQCQEIALPTSPMTNIEREDGEISLCTLAATNMGLVEEHELEEICDLTVRALDELLDYQNYPVKVAQLSTESRRSLGIGLINYAYFLAVRGLKYDDEALGVVDAWVERWSYSLIKASMQLAKEKGACGKFHETMYAKGKLPIDTYKRTVDELVKPSTRMTAEWDALRTDILEYGMRNSTLMALMPAETSAQISNSTNGIEPIRALVTKKMSKDGVMKQVAPEVTKLKHQYDMLWDQKTPEGYLHHVAVLQKYIDQSISANTSYNPVHYDVGGKIPAFNVLKDLLTAYNYGVKNLYYNNIEDGSGEVALDAKLPELSSSVMDDSSDCDSCKI